MNIRSKNAFAKSVSLLAAISVLASSPVMAQSWNPATSFTSPVWDFKTRSGPGCAVVAGTLLGYYTNNKGFVGHQGVTTPTIVPLVAFNPAATGPTISSTAQIPAKAVWMHPGESGPNMKCAVLRFQAPLPGKYRVSGFIKSIDTRANQVKGFLFASNQPAIAPLALSGPMGTSLPFDKVVKVLPGDRTIDFALDDAGSYYFDSTQLDLTITRCNGKKAGMPGKPDQIDAAGKPANIDGKGKPCGDSDGDDHNGGRDD